MNTGFAVNDAVVLNILFVTHVALNPSCKNGDVRLAGGGIENQGRVEVCINNRWGTICSGTSIGTTWDNRDAAVVCRTLGYDLKTTSKPLHNANR